jgi:hypothetical protein
MVRRNHGEVKHVFGRGFRMSMDWFVWENTEKPWFLPLNMGFSCKNSPQPIH